MASLTKLREVVRRVRDQTDTSFKDLTVQELEWLHEHAGDLATLVDELDEQMGDGDPPPEWLDAFREQDE